MPHLPPPPERQAQGFRIRTVPVERSIVWLERGFADFRAHPFIGLCYGGFFSIVGWLLTFGLEQNDMGSIILPLAGGFLLVAPFAACGLYEVSRRRERQEEVSLKSSLAAVFTNRRIGDLALASILVFLVWTQLAVMIFAFFYGSSPPRLTDWVGGILLSPQGPAFLATGTIVGAILAALVFSLSVVSVPMVMDRDVSAVEAMRTSLTATWQNRANMIGWAATLAFLQFAGIALLFVGLAFTLPLAAHASWHAYRDLVGNP